MFWIKFLQSQFRSIFSSLKVPKLHWRFFGEFRIILSINFCRRDLWVIFSVSSKISSLNENENDYQEFLSKVKNSFFLFFRKIPIFCLRILDYQLFFVNSLDMVISFSWFPHRGNLSFFVHKFFQNFFTNFSQ